MKRGKSEGSWPRQDDHFLIFWLRDRSRLIGVEHSVHQIWALARTFQHNLLVSTASMSGGSAAAAYLSYFLAIHNSDDFVYWKDCSPAV
jgi:hypothetical protein